MALTIATTTALTWWSSYVQSSLISLSLSAAGRVRKQETTTSFIFHEFIYYYYLTTNEVRTEQTERESKGRMSHYGSRGGGGGDRYGDRGGDRYGDRGGDRYGGGGGGGGGSFGSSSNLGAGLRSIQWDLSKLPNFEKNFYIEHPRVSARSEPDAVEWRRQNEISIVGQGIPKPVFDFEEASMPEYVLRGAEARIFKT